MRSCGSTQPEEFRALQIVGVFCGSVVLLRLLRRRPGLWQTAALGLAIIPFAVETSSYYTAWLSALVLGVATRARTCSMMLLSVACMPLLELLIAADDVRFAVDSVLLVLLQVVLLWSTSTAAGPPAQRRTAADCA